MLEATLSFHASADVVAILVMMMVGFVRWLVLRLQRGGKME